MEKPASPIEISEKFSGKAGLPESKEKLLKCLLDEAKKFFLAGQPSISFEVGYAYKSKVYVTGNIKVGDLSQRLEGTFIWNKQGTFIWNEKGDSFTGHLNLKPPVDRESLWKEYNYHIDLYKHYLDMGLKANGFFYAILGAIFSFVLTKGIPDDSVSLIAFSLSIPILMSLAFAGTFIYGAKLWEEVRWTINVIKSQLKIEKAPDVQILSVFLYTFGGIFLFVGLAIISLMFYLIFIRHCLFSVSLIPSFCA